MTYRRPAAALAVLALVSAGLLGPGLVGQPAVAGGASAPAATPLRVTITDLSPVSATPQSTVTIHGTVTNTTAGTIDELAPTVGLGRQVTGRSDLMTDFGAPPGLAYILTALNDTAPKSLGPGATVAFSLGLKLAEADLPNVDTVYPLEIRFDSDEGGVEATGLGRADTFLPYFAGTVSAPLRVGWLWPIDATPVQAADDTISDPGFPAELSPAGRLGRLVNLATPPPGQAAHYARVSWVIEPSLLSAAEQTATSRWRRTGAASSAAQPPDPAAAAFLARLSAATAEQEVIPLPYADPDAVALTRAGLTEDLGTAVALGNVTVAQQLPRAEQAPVAFPVNGAADQATVDAYAAAGERQVVLSGDQLPAAVNPAPPTATAVGSLTTQGPTIGTLSTDDEVQTLVDAGGRDAPTPAMAAQRLLALLATVVAQAPNQQGLIRDLVISSDRNQDPESAWARDVLTDIGSVQWLQSVAVGDMASDPIGRSGPLLAYPAAARKAELPQSTLVGAATGDNITSLRTLVSDLGTMINRPAITQPMDLLLSRAESLSWRVDPAGSTALRSAVVQDVAVLFAGVRVSAAAEVTLASRTGTIPVTVQNSLPEPVTVRLTLETPDKTKLSSSTGLLVTVPAGHKEREQLPASTQRAGTFRVQLEATTPDGRPVSSVPLVVHSRAYGAIAVAITVVALGVLVLAILVRSVRRLRARSRDRSAA